MAEKLLEGKVKSIFAQHRPPGRKYRGTYMSRQDPYRAASLTLWAETEQGDIVWIATASNDTRNVDSRMKKFEEANACLIGQTIKYALKCGTGFIRSYQVPRQQHIP
ncbi:MAG: hypothetical protein NT076_01380 [Candidatus Pacearchaeota archaeon]|nr:hypothetical protein [Candidatus Pacearchaeota archaeon]